MVVAIVAILAMIAYPLYTRYVEKSRRTAAVTALERVASAEEKYYAIHNVYASSLASLGYAGTSVNVPSNDQPWYAMSITSTGGDSYTITAAPENAQAKDTCGAFTLNAAGTRSVSGSESAADCWGS